MFRFSQIGSRFLSYWSYKGEILHWNFWPLSLHYSLIVPTCWYPKTLHIPFWTMKQTNSLSMCRMNFDTTTCFFFDVPDYSRTRFPTQNFLLDILWSFLFFGMNTPWLFCDFFLHWFSIRTKCAQIHTSSSFEWKFAILIQFIFSLSCFTKFLYSFPKTK